MATYMRLCSIVYLSYQRHTELLQTKSKKYITLLTFSRSGCVSGSSFTRVSASVDLSMAACRQNADTASYNARLRGGGEGPYLRAQHAVLKHSHVGHRDALQIFGIRQPSLLDGALEDGIGLRKVIHVVITHGSL